LYFSVRTSMYSTITATVLATQDSCRTAPRISEVQED
jgi:hypothetical protein